MSLIRSASPWAEMLTLRQAMDRLFEDSVVRPRSLMSESIEGHWLPLDIHATPDTIVVEGALPGVKPEDVEIIVTGHTLTITGKMADESSKEEHGYLLHELRRGSFSRTVTLPRDAGTDGATASFENGLLRLVIPKAEAAKPRQIPLSSSNGVAQREAPSIETREPVAAGAGNDR